MNTQETMHADIGHSCPAQWADRAKEIPAWQRLLNFCRYRKALRSSASLRFVIVLDTDEAGNLREWWVSARCAEIMSRIHVILDWDQFLRGLVVQSRNRGLVRGVGLIPAKATRSPEFQVADLKDKDLESVAVELARHCHRFGPGTALPFFRSGDYLYMNAGWTFDLSKTLDRRVFESGLWLVPESVFSEKDLSRDLLT